jgi:formylglycine-generating enzyme required for sulfatase activity
MSHHRVCYSVTSSPVSFAKGPLTRYLPPAILAAAIVFVLASASALAGPRVALLLAAEEYSQFAKSPISAKFAKDIGTALERHGFQVTVYQNPTNSVSRAAVLSFAQKAAGADAAIVILTGHGAVADGLTYFLPINTEITRASDLFSRGLPLPSVAQIAGRAKVGAILFIMTVPNFSSTLPSVSSRPRLTEPLAPNVVVAFSTSDRVLPASRMDVVSQQAIADLLMAAEEPKLKLPALIAAASGGGLGKVVGDVPDPDWTRPPDAYYPRAAERSNEEPKRQQLDVAAPPAQSAPTKPVQPAAAEALSHCYGVELTVGRNEHRCLRPGAGKTDWFKDCPICPEMVVPPMGEFLMGSAPAEISALSAEQPDLTETLKWEAPQREIVMSRPFAIGRSHVTRSEFKAFVDATRYHVDGGCYTYDGSLWTLDDSRSWLSPGFEQTDRHPVVCVSWYDASAYVQWLSKHTGRTYRLLSEAEMEYATRATSSEANNLSRLQPRYFFGDDVGSLCIYGNGASQTAAAKFGWQPQQVAPCRDGYVFTAPVASFASNPWGLYDVHGNVWTWTADCWNKDHTRANADGTARTSGDCGQRVVRGGSWSNRPSDLRVGARDHNATTDRTSNLGFRLARALDE